MTEFKYEYNFDPKDLNKHDEELSKAVKSILDLDKEEDKPVVAGLVHTLKLVHMMPKPQASDYVVNQIRFCSYILRGWTGDEEMQKLAKLIADDKAKIEIFAHEKGILNS